jgi:hypothetical protein
MTGRDRILAALAGERPDQVPFVPNLWQWFHVNRRAGRLPEALWDARDPLEALRRLGADILSKFDGLVVRETLDACRSEVTFEGDRIDGSIWTAFGEFQGGTVRREQIETPHGTLARTWRYDDRAGAPFEIEHAWKDFDRELPAVRSWMRDRRYRIDRQALRDGASRLGDDGLLLVQILPTPLKELHRLAGPEAASLWIVDHPEAMRDLARLHEAQALDLLEAAVDLPEVEAVEMPDNLDSAFYSPRLFREFCLPLIRRSADLVHARGKSLFIHACGRLKALAPSIVESGVDCVEGQAHPPVGDWSLPEARAASDRLILCGGMTAVEQGWSGPEVSARAREAVRALFGELGGTRRLLFGSGCNTAPGTAWETLIAFRDAVRECGA